jgi:hypothetical protein
METKKAKVTKVTKMDKKDNYGNTSFIIEFEGGDKGYYNSKYEDQTKFVAGNVADYNIEKKEGSKGPYYKITLPQSDKPAFTGGGGRPQQDPKVQMISFAAAYTKDLIVGGKLPMENLEIGFERMYKMMTSKL